MSIDYLFDLERDIDNGKDYYACPNVGKNQWTIAETKEELSRVALRSANHKKMAVNIVRLVSKLEAVSGDYFLVPTKISDSGMRGEPMIEWAVVETRDASEMMRDLRHGPAPYFAMQIEETVEPTA